MKNKSLLLLIVPTLLMAVPSINAFNKVTASSMDDTTKTTIINNLTGGLKIEADVSFPALVDYQTVIEYSENNYFYELYVGGSLVSTYSVYEGSDTYAYKEYLDSNNTIKADVLMVSEEEALVFDDEFTPLFANLVNVDATNFDKYFNYELVDEKYQITLTDIGNGLLRKDIATFFPVLDGYAWDNLSLTYEIKNFTLTTSTTGELQRLTFDKIKKDKFGGYIEEFICDISSIEIAKGIEPLEAIMPSEDLASFNTQLDNFISKLENGNFIQTIGIMDANTQKFTSAYQNFYQLDREKEEEIPNMMISSYPFFDGTANALATLACIQDISGVYAPYGFIPSTGNFTQTTDLRFNSTMELIPNLSEISSNFYFKNENNGSISYIIDFASLSQFNTKFAAHLLDALFGGFDPVVTFIGDYVNFDYYDYTFNYLQVLFDENGNANFILNFDNEEGNFNSISTFSKFNEVELTTEEDVKDVANWIIEIYREN